MQYHIKGIFHGSGFGDDSGVDEEYLVGIFDGIESVGYDYLCGLFWKFVKDFLEKLFCDRIDIGCCFIEYKELWIS